MIIKLPKPEIKCPDCGYKIEEFDIEGHTVDIVSIISYCDKCGSEIEVIIKFEDEQTFCNCELCKKLMVDKGSKVN